MPSSGPCSARSSPTPPSPSPPRPADAPAARRARARRHSAVGLLVAAITTLAFRIGSRAVLAIPPLRALESGVEPPPGTTRSVGRTVTAAALFLSGAAGLGVAVVLGASTVDALLLAVGCGALSFTGVVVASPVLLPAVLRLVAAATARSVIPAMARAQLPACTEADRPCDRRLLIAVTLMATFAVGFATYASMLSQQAAGDPEYYRGIEEQFDKLAVMFTVSSARRGHRRRRRGRGHRADDRAARP